MKLHKLGQAPKLLFLCALFFITNFKTHATSIDATTSIPGSIDFENGPVIFAGGEHAYGFVRFTQGFTANGILNINVLFPVAGAININTSGGQLVLDGDLTLGSNATLPNGGIINGQGNTLFLQGDLTIPANQTLTISGNLTIDCQGHSIFFSDNAILLINGVASTVLTIRNANIIGLQNITPSSSSIQFGPALSQKLVLNDVNLLLREADFTFRGGALDIVNVVTIRDDYDIFEYASSYNLTITQNSRLFMDISSVFYYNPEDGLQTHIVMEDLTSQMYLNGSLFASGPGLILTKGHLLIDHDVVFAPLDTTTRNTGFFFGDGNVSNNLQIDIFPGAGIDVNQGFLTYKNTN